MLLNTWEILGNWILINNMNSCSWTLWAVPSYLLNPVILCYFSLFTHLDITLTLYLDVHRQGVIFPTEYIVGTDWNHFGYDGIEVTFHLHPAHVIYLSVIDGGVVLFGKDNWSFLLGHAPC